MFKKMRKAVSFALVVTLITTMCPMGQLVNTKADTDTSYCISEGRHVYVSSGSNEDYAVDGDISTRWESEYKNKTEWMYVDLGKTADIDYIYLKWEAAYAKSYQIQFSNDEENWTTVYTKGNGSTSEETPEETAKPGAIAIKTSSKKLNSNGTVSTIFSWDAVSGAVTYKIFVENNDEEEVATAPDGYTFDKNSRLDLINEVKLLEGTHKYIVRAYDKDMNVITSGEITLSGDYNVEETTTKSSSQNDESNVITDEKEQTIDLTKILKDEKDRQARYVRIYMTEKALPAYGYSIFEFQVYGKNGVVERPADYGENIALNKPVVSKANIVSSGDTEKEVSVRDEWWMYDEEGNLKEDAYNNVKPENAVDGKSNTSFTSYQDDDQWIYVDLEKQYTIGRVIVEWNSDAGKIYDIQVSADAKEWTTVHRYLEGYPEHTDNVTMYYENVRYVRIFGYTRVESGSGFGINELKVYRYKEGESKENEKIASLPTRQIVNSNTGKGSYVSGEMYKEKNKLPVFVNEENITTPIDSNSWWSSAMIKTFSNLLCATPLKAKFSTKGLGVLLATAGWVGERKDTDLGTDQTTETEIDFYVMPDGYNSKNGYDRVENYGDYSVQLGLMDNNGLCMKSTIVKGSPYIFNEFCDNTTFFINSSSIAEIFDDDGKSILTKEGEKIVTDHIGIKTMDEQNTKAMNDGSYYCINVPENTTFKVMVAGSKYNIKVTFPSKEENYMSIGAMTKKDDINEYYKHGYAFVTDTYVGYTFDKNNNKIVTNYTATTKSMRKGFSDVTMHCLFPHQWKYTNEADTPFATYTSIRGDMKSIWANKYTTTQQFSGLLPTFATPESDMLDTEEMVTYLNQVVASKVNTTPVADAYWEGKNVHPLAISALMADQLGETEIREKLLAKLKSIMVDWFTYDGESDECYLIYNEDWGTLYYPESSFGANAAICDHHFTYGYFMFGAAVLSTYDKQFYNDYKEMIELLVRDYANPNEPEDDGNMFCKFRAFDQYSGHSWAGGYADSDSGNNQESASEALFSWVGMYLWGEVTGDDTYIDAGAYGFTTEMEAVLQYWFDYDETNWLGDNPDREADKVYDYPFQGTGQIYGASMGYGTFFGGEPLYVYGIHWLPISEYLTNYGMNQEKCAKVYQGLLDDTEYAINIEKKLLQQDIENGIAAEDSGHKPDSYTTADTGWQHITWPFLSQTNPTSAYEKFENNVTKVQVEDRCSTLWFIAAMDQLGYRTNDYMVCGEISGSVYCKDTNGKKVYTAEVWNGTDSTKQVTIKTKAGKEIGTAKVGSKSFVSFNIDTDKEFEMIQTSTPTVKATGLVDGKITDNISGKVTFENTQLVELLCEDNEAKIYYTTDGSIPTEKSKEYKESILISSDTTLKAVAIKDGYINSSYSATVISIEGDKVYGNDNVAMKKNVIASSENSGNSAFMAVDGDSTTRWQASKAEDDEYLQIDLGEEKSINRVTINWEAAYAEKYEIQVSLDGEEWTRVARENGIAGEITSEFPATKARYVRMQGIARGTEYGYSIYEIQVYSALQAKAPTITPESGIYDDVQTVTMSTSVKGAEIKYTTDGSMPTEESETYRGPITISKSTAFKAVTYRKGMLLSDVTEAEIIIKGTLSLNKTDEKVAIGNKLQLKAITDEKVTYLSNNTSVATVGSDGIVEGIAKGNTVITVKAENGQTAECKITVIDAIHITSIKLDKESIEVKNKSQVSLKLTINPSNTTDDTTITWTSDDEKIATVDLNGLVTAVKEGRTTIRAKVGKLEAICEITVIPVSVEEMVASGKFNMALGKNVVALPNKREGEGGTESNLTDGNFDGKHIATEWNTLGTSYTIDLEDAYDSSTLDKIVVKYRENNDGDIPVKGYEIQYSVNGVDFTTVKKVDGTTVKAACNSNNCVDIQDMSGINEKVRYVRFYYPDAYAYGIQVTEIAVLSTEQNAKKTELEYCDNPSELQAVSDKYCQITYTIIPGENQLDYKYMVYLNNKLVGDRVNAGTYTVNGLEAGSYEVKVVSYYNKLTSRGIVKEVIVDDGSLKEYINTVRNISKGATVTVESIDSNEGNKELSSLTDGVLSEDNGICVHTQSGKKEATICLDLGANYSISYVEEFLIAFKEENTYASEYTVEFSEDGQKYDEVISVQGAKYKKVIENKIDVASYEYGTVRYVRVKLLDGNYNWGYQLSEIAIIGTDVYMPKPSTKPDIIPTSKQDTTSEPTTTPKEDTTPKADVSTQPDETSSVTNQEKDTAGSKDVTTTSKKSIKTTVEVGNTKVNKATKKKKYTKAKISLKKVKGAKGYVVKVSTTKRFKKKNTVTKTFKKNVFTFKKLKKNKKYYVKARAFRTANGTKYYGKWCKVKQIKFIK